LKLEQHIQKEANITKILLKVALNTIKQTILILHQTPVFSLGLLILALAVFSNI
jgi:hypothetical protein